MVKILIMKQITQIKTFTSEISLNTFLSTANQVEYVDLKPSGDDLILIFKITI